MKYTPIEDLRQSEMHQQLAAKLCAAMLSQTMGVTLATAFKKVEAAKDPIGDGWLHLADIALDMHSRNMDALCGAHTRIETSRPQ